MAQMARVNTLGAFGVRGRVKRYIEIMCECQYLTVGEIYEVEIFDNELDHWNPMAHITQISPTRVLGVNISKHRPYRMTDPAGPRRQNWRELGPLEVLAREAE